MKEKKLKIQEELAELREELNRVDRLNLDSEALKAEISRLTARRAELEKKLIEDVFSAEPDNLPGAWQGLRKGMIAATVSPAFRWIATVALVYLLLVAVGCLGAGFKEAFGGSEGAKSLFRFATNPFMGLVVGILSTALIQSSSTTTSIVVALCAAGMPIEAAVPMIMGANVGTSVTNTLVSLGSIGNRRTFRRAFAAATVHDFFNLLAIVIFLPLEIAFHFLEKISGWFAGLLYGSGGLDLDGLNFLKPAERGAQQLFAALPGPEWIGNAAFIVFGLALICSIAFLRGIPLSCAGGLAALASRRKGLAFLYVVGVFFLLPLVCLGVYRLF